MALDFWPPTIYGLIRGGFLGRKEYGNGLMDTFIVLAGMGLFLHRIADKFRQQVQYTNELNKQKFDFRVGGCLLGLFQS